MCRWVMALMLLLLSMPNTIILMVMGVVVDIAIPTDAVDMEDGDGDGVVA